MESAIVLAGVVAASLGPHGYTWCPGRIHGGSARFEEGGLPPGPKPHRSVTPPATRVLESVESSGATAPVAALVAR